MATPQLGPARVELGFQPTNNPNEYTAKFHGNAAVKATKSRARFYPGLSSKAPATFAFYELACEKLAGKERLVDFGCGSGAGTLLLSRKFPEVYGLDNATEALDFARLLAPRATYVRADAADLAAGSNLDAAVVIDVLGHVSSPFAALQALRRAMVEGGKIFVVEPRAYPSQLLTAPLRRGFSMRALRCALVSAGFDIEEWVSEAGSFIACVAVAASGGEFAALLEGAVALSRNDAASAQSAYGRAIESSRSEVRLEARISLGDLAFAMGDAERACDHFAAAKLEDPKDPRALAALSQVALATGELASALDLAKQARNADTTDVGAACALALAATKVSDKDGLLAWHVATKLAPDQLPIAAEFVASARACGQPTASIRILERLRAYGDAMPWEYHLMAAEALVAVDRPADADIEIRMGLALNPRRPELLELARELAMASRAKKSR